jgi:di/tricarboxylate transporter
MTPQIFLTLTIIVVAIVLFATEKLRVDVVALLVLLTLILTRLVSPEEAFAGFSNPAVITVWAVYIVSGGLFKTGVADFMGQFIDILAPDLAIVLNKSAHLRRKIWVRLTNTNRNTVPMRPGLR